MIRGVFFLILFLTCFLANGITDTVFVKSTNPINLLINGKVIHKIDQLILPLVLPADGEVVIQSGQHSIVLNRSELQFTKSLISIDSALHYTVLKVVEKADAADGRWIMRRELSDFNKAVTQENTEEYLAYPGKYPEGYLVKDILRLLNELLAGSLADQLQVLMKQQNYSLATDVALSLKSIKNKPGFDDKSFSLLASYQLKLAKQASSNHRLQTALQLATKAYELDRLSRTKLFLDSLQVAITKNNFNDNIKQADSLFKKGDKVGALSHFRSALSIDQNDPTLKEKIDSLDIFLQDSLFQGARKQDVKNELVYYRQKNYTAYLDRYPFGKHAAESKARIQKLEKVSRQLNRYFIMVGQGFLSINGFQPATSVKIGKFNEHSIYYLGARINKDGFDLRNTPYQKDAENYISPAPGNFRIASPVIYGKNQYLSQGAVFAGYSKMIGKPGIFQFFITASIGYGWAKQWVLTHKNENTFMLNFKPEVTPQFRQYEERKSSYPAGLGFLFNYKTFCFEVGADVYQSYAGYSYSIGFSF